MTELPTSTNTSPPDQPEIEYHDRSGALAIGVMVVAIALLVVVVLAIVQAM